MSHTIYKDHRNSSGPLKVMKMADIKRVRWRQGRLGAPAYHVWNNRKVISMSLCECVCVYLHAWQVFCIPFPM